VEVGVGVEGEGEGEGEEERAEWHDRSGDHGTRDRPIESYDKAINYYKVE
jgi:hypothetical protein